MSHLPTDLRLGEGFAFFRWHVLTFTTNDCSYTEQSNICSNEWDCMQHEAVTALREVSDGK